MAMRSMTARQRWEAAAQALDEASLPIVYQQLQTQLSDAAFYDLTGLTPGEVEEWIEPENYEDHGGTGHRSLPWYDANWEP